MILKVDKDTDTIVVIYAQVTFITNGMDIGDIVTLNILMNLFMMNANIDSYHLLENLAKEFPSSATMDDTLVSISSSNISNFSKVFFWSLT